MQCAQGLGIHPNVKGIYEAKGYLSKIDATFNEKMLDYAAMTFQHLYDSYLQQTKGNVYFSVIPDKNYYLAEPNGYEAMDYDAFINYICSKTEYMQYIDITDTLSLEKYYKTDSHWRQEGLIDTAKKIASAMGVSLNGTYDTKTLDIPFYGSFVNDYDYKVEPDKIQYLTNDSLDNCKVTSIGAGGEVEVKIYDIEKAKTKPYDLFLSGTQAIITVENPDAVTDKELILFRDSFGSSIAPLLVEGYTKVTLVDIRYILSDMLGEYIEFNNQDVLFLYSVTLLNNSTALK